jgi:pimeloyl-ACP methyl ester carboxylesterase
MSSKARARFLGTVKSTVSLVSNLPSALTSEPPTLSGRYAAALDRQPRDTPVVLVHGYAASAQCWTPLATRLAAEGFTSLHAFTYNPFTCDVDSAARALSAAARDLLADGGSGHLHLLGHSLGGLLARVATERHGLWPHVGVLATIATPHRGASWSRLALGPNRSWLRPGRSALPEPSVRCGDAETPVYLNYYFTEDALVPTRSARLAGAGVHNIELTGTGHLGAAADPRLLTVVPQHLRAFDQAHSQPASPWPTGRRRAPGDGGSCLYCEIDAASQGPAA